MTDSTSFSASNKSAISVAVIGTGYWGKNLVRTFSELGVLAGIVDVDFDTASSLAATYNVDSMEFNEVLSNSNIDSLVIATPAASHYYMAKKSLLANKDTFVEKPLALEVHQAEELVSIAQEKNKILMVGHLLQYHPAYIELYKLVKDGKLGNVRYVYSNRLNLGKLRKEENILWSFAPHDVSMILSIFDGLPEKVSAIGSFYVQNSIADVTTTHLEFSSGQNAHIFVSWLHPFKEQKLIVVGDAGMAVFDDQLPWDKKLTKYAHEIRWENNVPVPYKAKGEKIVLKKAEPLKLEAEHFLLSVKNRTRPRTDGVEGTMVLRVLEAAEKSMREKKSIKSVLTKIENIGEFFVHPTAIVDQPSLIKKGTKIWHFSHVLSGSNIGENCNIGQNVMIGPDVSIGDSCKIQNNVSIYKGVHLEDEVFCGPSSVFTNVLNPRASVDRKNEFKETYVRKGATIGANASIVCGVELGEYCFVGAGAVVTKNVLPFSLVIGSPARQVGWVSHEGEKLDENLVCPRSGRKYSINDKGKLFEIKK